MDQKKRHKAQMVKKMIEVQQKNQPKCYCANGETLEAGREGGKEMKASVNGNELCDSCWHNRAIGDKVREFAGHKDTSNCSLSKNEPLIWNQAFESWNWVNSNIVH